MMVLRKQVRTAAINKAIEAEGGKERLYKGDGYWYFADGDADKWPVTSVTVHRLNAYTLKQWLDIWRTWRDEYLNS